MSYWFITGTSKGLGRVFVEYLAARGEMIFATARDVSDIHDLEVRFPGKVKVFPLDITDKDQINRAVSNALESFGRIDVLVNNAGFGIAGPIEAISDLQTRAIFETNVFGTLNVTRAVLPSMRANCSGHIIQISSSHAWGSGPGIGMYAASKCALEGATEAIAAEVKPFNIRVTIFQPGPYKSDFLGKNLGYAERNIEDYEPLMRGITQAAQESHLKQPGDPLGIAAALLKISACEQPPLRLLLGKIATERALSKLLESRQEVDSWLEYSIAADAAPS